MTGINEDRGARRAAALKKRFRKVSDRSFGRFGTFRAGKPSSTGATPGGGPGSFGRKVVIWLAIGAAAYALGTVVT